MSTLGKVGISAVDIRDIAEAAAIVLTSDGHFAKTCNLNGPEVVSGPKAASIWSKVLGKEFRYAGDGDLEPLCGLASSFNPWLSSNMGVRK